MNSSANSLARRRWRPLVVAIIVIVMAALAVSVALSQALNEVQYVPASDTEHRVGQVTYP